MRFLFETLGCRLNEAEISGWRRQVRAAGHTVVADVNSADVVVFNSCAVTAKAARTSRKTTRGFTRYYRMLFQFGGRCGSGSRWGRFGRGK
jgi:threonylcarbamoyladenosine tRNA methylthiotransferase MtaB